MKLFKLLLFFIILFSSLFAKQLELSISSNPARINPILATDSASSEISGWIFNGLFKYDKDANIIGDLASTWEFKDATTLIVNLKKNILWHDGVKFSADDVIFTYELIMSPKIFTPIKTTFLKVQSIEKIDNYTIKITYKEPYFKALHIWMSGIVPKHILEKEKDIMTSSFNKNPIGTGSYTLKSFKPSSDILLEAYENYFDGTPKIKTIRYKFLPDPNTNFAMLNQQKLDLGSLTPLQLDRQIPDDFQSKFSIFEKPSFSYTYLGFNLSNPKFKNPKIREAIDLAIDKKEIVDILFFSHGSICNGSFLPDTFAYNDTIKSIHDPKKAKTILQTLGYTDKNPLEFTVITNANNSIRVNAAQIIQYQLKKIGVNMKIKVMEWQAFLNTIVMPKKFEAIILGWGLSLMPDARSIWHSSSAKMGGFNLVGYNNALVDKNIERAEKTTDLKILSKLYKEIFATIKKENPYIFLYIPNSITVVSKGIKNVTPSIIGVTHNQKDWIKE